MQAEVQEGLARRTLPMDGGAYDYSRQIALREVGPAGQERLRSAKVLVVGAGGLGVPVLSYLAGAGIGSLGIIEDDVVDASNLHRQTLYSFGDVGKGKAKLAARKITALNPEIVVQVHAERVTARNVAGLMAGYDIVVDCTDNFSTTFLINDAVVTAGKVAVFAGIYQYEGSLQTYRGDLPGSPCFRCVWPESTADGIVGNCREAGVLGPVPGVLGALQALEVLKIVLGLRGQLVGEVLMVDLLSLTQDKVRAKRREDCCGCGSARVGESLHEPAELELRFSTLADAVAAGYVLIDIREPDEIALLPIQAVPVQCHPMKSLLDSPRLDPGHRYLLICARGTRSRGTAEQLRRRGYTQVYSLRGGLHKVSDLA